MRVLYFLDTNVVLYAVSKAADEVRKKTIARRLLGHPEIGFSAQVLQEFFDNATRKKTFALSAEEASAILQTLVVFPVVPITATLVMTAARNSPRHRISYWDAAILAAAKELNATTVFSEDLNHGQSYDGVTVLNPFLPGVQLPAAGAAVSLA